MPIGKMGYRWFALLVAVVVAAFGLAACGDDDGGEPAGAGTPDATSEPEASGSGDLEGSIRLGYFANVTHAPALIGAEEGFFADALGPDVDITTQTFNSGSTEVEALLAGSLDIAYIGPNPAISGWQQSEGTALHIVSGATSGGAALVVDDQITGPEDLAGKTLATPSVGNTQDVALRHWLAEQGYETTPEGGGDVTIAPSENDVTLDLFRTGEIDGAWVPEPWATRLVDEGGGHVLVDEADLWPDGQFVTTHIIVASSFLEEHPDLVEAFLAGHIRAVDFANDEPDAAQADVVAQISEITGQEVNPAVIAGAWEHLEFTEDPIATSLQTSADHAQEVGLLDPVDLEGIYDLTLLNQLLADLGRPEVEASLT